MLGAALILAAMQFPPSCGDLTTIFDALKNKYGERTLFIGTLEGSSKPNMWILGNPLTKTWTIVVERWPKVGCMIVGRDFKAMFGTDL